MSGGTSVSGPEDFPFHVALIDETKSFLCGGSLITKKHVLTAGHCIHQKYSAKLRREDVYVKLGNHGLSSTQNTFRGIKKILIHEDWNPYSLKNNADLAILVMNASVQFSEVIRPICLTTNEEALKISTGKVVRI